MTDLNDTTKTRSKNVNLTFRVNAEEHSLVKQRMQDAGITNMRAFLLKMALPLIEKYESWFPSLYSIYLRELLL
jgi:hypothetical protein